MSSARSSPSTRCDTRPPTRSKAGSFTHNGEHGCAQSVGAPRTVCPDKNGGKSMALSLKTQALMAAALLAMPTVAPAQNEQVADQANEVAEQAQQLEQEANSLTNVAADDRSDAARADADRGDRDDGDDDDDSGKWGLLGLLGLAGLLGLKRRDDDHRDHDHVRTAAGTTRTGTRTDTDTRL